MPSYQIQVRGLLDGSTNFIVPDPLPQPDNGGVIKIDAGVGVNVGAFDLQRLVFDAAAPVWVRAFHIEYANGTRAGRNSFVIDGSRQDESLTPVIATPSGNMLMRPFVLNSHAIAQTGVSSLQCLTDDTNEAFNGAPVAGPHFVYLDLEPLLSDEQVTMVQEMTSGADVKSRLDGVVVESVQALAASLSEDAVALWVSPVDDDVSFNTSSGQFVSAQVTVGTAPAAGESMVILVQRVFSPGAPVTIGTITIDDTFADNSVTPIPILSAGNELLSETRIRIVRTYVAGMAPAPMSDTIVRVEVAPVRRE